MNSGLARHDDDGASRGGEDMANGPVQGRTERLGSSCDRVGRSDTHAG